MADYLDFHYASLVASKLERYKIVSSNPAKINFRCHLCGDSKKSKSKARGWLLQNKEGNLHYFCHNCGAAQSFPNFLKSVDHTAYNNYIADKFSHKKVEKTPLEVMKHEAPVFDRDALSKIKKISQLKHDHPAKLYIAARKIPADQHWKIYYAPKFNAWINSIIPNKFDPKIPDEPRLIFPFKDKDGKLFGVSARSFNPRSQLRYISIMFDPNMPKIFGLNSVDYKKQYYICEGAIDSLFLNNSIAMAGADGNLTGLDNTENSIMCFDNEPRNREIHKRMERIIKAGNKICIWPSNIEQKDINEMILAGISNVAEIISKNSFSGLEATMKLSAWRKV